MLGLSVKLWEEEGEEDFCLLLPGLTSVTILLDALLKSLADEVAPKDFALLSSHRRVTITRASRKDDVQYIYQFDTMSFGIGFVICFMRVSLSSYFGKLQVGMNKEEMKLLSFHR